MLSADQDKIITQEIFVWAHKELNDMRDEVAKKEVAPARLIILATVFPMVEKSINSGKA